MEVLSFLQKPLQTIFFSNKHLVVALYKYRVIGLQWLPVLLKIDNIKLIVTWCGFFCTVLPPTTLIVGSNAFGIEFSEPVSVSRFLIFDIKF